MKVKNQPSADFAPLNNTLGDDFALFLFHLQTGLHYSQTSDPRTLIMPQKGRRTRYCKLTCGHQFHWWYSTRTEQPATLSPPSAAIASYLLDVKAVHLRGLSLYFILVL